MKKRLLMQFVLCFALTLASNTGIAASHKEGEKPKTTGQGEYKFKVLQTRDILPEKATEVLEKAHGGFAVDRRSGKGEIYFALPGTGIIRIDNNYAAATLLETDPAMRDTNMHNCTIWYTDDGNPRLVFPGNSVGKVFTTDLDGKLLDTLNAPTSENDFQDYPPVNAYFHEGGAFVPTDVEYLREMYYVTTGYSKLDYVLTADVEDEPTIATWSDLAFGGKGDGPGQFGTGHGITVSPDGNKIHVADRPNAQIEHFTRHGHFLKHIQLPIGSLACDVDYTAGLALVPCLRGPEKDKGAPIYLMKNDEIISTIMIKEDLGLEKFTHIHNAVLTTRNGVLYIIAQAWNPGDFTILAQVIEDEE